MISVLGQSEKNSVRAYVFRFAPQFGHCSTQLALRIWARSGHGWVGPGALNEASKFRSRVGVTMVV